jgi:hypothetical protein
MVGTAAHGRWGLKKYNEKKVCRLKDDITCDLEARGLTLLGWPYGDKEILLSIWMFLYQGWFGDQVLGG